MSQQISHRLFGLVQQLGQVLFTCQSILLVISHRRNEEALMALRASFSTRRGLRQGDPIRMEEEVRDFVGCHHSCLNLEVSL